MNNKEFEKILNKRIELIKSVLSKKGNEYSGSSFNDRLHNFKRAAAILGVTPEQSLLGMKVKHDVSVIDIVENIIGYNDLPSKELLEEKIGDSINYLILLEAMIKERMKKVKQN